MKMTKYAVSHVYCTASGGQLTHGDTERLNVDFHLKLWVVFFSLLPGCSSDRQCRSLSLFVFDRSKKEKAALILSE